MDTRKLYFDMDITGQEQLIKKCGGKGYTYDQINNWIFSNMVFDFNGMTNLSKTFRSRISSKAVVNPASCAGRQKSSDRTVKLLAEYRDGVSVECVGIPAGDRLTLCISTMAGCPCRCVFCASGKDGLKSKLSCGDMLGQFFLLSEEFGDYPTNIVLMGSGEPLLNYTETVKFLKILNSSDHANIGARRITVSTIGIPEKIIALSEERTQFELALSLHHPDENKRRELMPGSAAYPFAAVMEALIVYTKRTNRLVTFEYCLMKNINDSVQCAEETAALAKRINAKVNLIPYNPHTSAFAPPSDKRIQDFKNTLTQQGIDVFIRTDRGTDISAACGQLVGKNK